jgi:hypothetical protein
MTLVAYINNRGVTAIHTVHGIIVTEFWMVLKVDITCIAWCCQYDFL